MWLLDCAASHAPRNVLDLTFLASKHTMSPIKPGVAQHQVTLMHSGHPNRPKVRRKYSRGAPSMREWRWRWPPGSPRDHAPQRRSEQGPRTKQAAREGGHTQKRPHSRSFSKVQHAPRGLSDRTAQERSIPLAYEGGRMAGPPRLKT